jgi:putative phosphoribosyl transferase
VELFADRSDAGRRLADRLASLRGDDAIVLGLPRGGVVVAAPVAQALGLPLDVLAAAKIGVPDHPELAMGAVATGGVVVLDDALIADLGVTPLSVELAKRQALADLARREHAFRGDRDPVRLRARRVVLVDDGLATGSTMQAATEAARAGGASEIVVALPVASSSGLREIRGRADRTVCLFAPSRFVAVSQFYRDFAQVDDEEVRALLARYHRPGPA